MSYGRSQLINNGWVKSEGCPDGMSMYTSPKYPGIMVKSLDTEMGGSQRWNIYRGHTLLHTCGYLVDVWFWIGRSLELLRVEVIPSTVAQPCHNEVSKFWFIFGEGKHWFSKQAHQLCRHDTHDAAQTELDRLSKANPGQKFTLMCSVSDMTTAKPVPVHDEYRRHV